MNSVTKVRTLIYNENLIDFTFYLVTEHDIVTDTKAKVIVVTPCVWTFKEHTNGYTMQLIPNQKKTIVLRWGENYPDPDGILRHMNPVARKQS